MILLTDYVSHPYKTTVKTVIIYIPFLAFWKLRWMTTFFELNNNHVHNLFL